MFALIIGGIVNQIDAAMFPVHPSLLWRDISAVSPTPQVGWTYDGSVFTPPHVVALTFAQQADAAYAEFIAAGLVLTFTDAPAVNGTYAIDQAATIAIGQVDQFIARYAAFPSKADTMAWPLMDGSAVTFSSPAVFAAFARAAAETMFAADMAAAATASGKIVPMPSNAMTIP